MQKCWVFFYCFMCQSCYNLKTNLNRVFNGILSWLLINIDDISNVEFDLTTREYNVFIFSIKILILIIYGFAWVIHKAQTLLINQSNDIFMCTFDFVFLCHFIHWNNLCCGWACLLSIKLWTCDKTKVCCFLMSFVFLYFIHINLMYKCNHEKWFDLKKY